MPTAVVTGAGPVGLAVAMLLARDGYRVTVLDKDAQEPPDDPWDAWHNWERGGVAQFRQPHLVLPRFRQLIDAELPDVRDELVRLGGRRLSLLELMAPSVTDRAPRPGDEQFETLTARRPILETAFAQVARNTPGVDVRRGVAVEGPVAGRSQVPEVPHVAGVRTTDGEQVLADLVVDAMGRRSKAPEWVAGLGGPPVPEETSDAGFAYYSRCYRSQSGSLPEFRAPFGVDLATVRVLTLPGDNGAWTVALIPIAGDAPFKGLRHNQTWERVVRAFPHAAHWIDAEPLHDVLPMAGVLDRHRRLVVEGRPALTGLVSVGDAWACTNPTAGRGLSLGVAHAIALRDAARTHGDDPARLAVAFDEATEAALTPWYRDQVARDLDRAAATQAVIEGAPPPRPPDPNVAAFFAAAAQDPVVARAGFEIFGVLALPAEVMGRPDVRERVAAFAGLVPPPLPGPSRADLLSILG